MGNNCSTKPKGISQRKQKTDASLSPTEILYFNSAKACEDIGQYAKALEFYNFAAQVDPRSAKAYFGVANCLFKMGDETRSLQFY